MTTSRTTKLTTTRTTSLTTKRIIGESVKPLLPIGDVYVFVVGEAPGPRGADKSGIPFFGDAAGLHLYRALVSMHAVELPPAVEQMSWDGAQFAAAHLTPIARGVALGNAFDRCPTDDGHSFRTPSKSELDGEDNMQRLQSEIDALRARGLRGIVTLGRVATRTVDTVLAAMAGSKFGVESTPASRSAAASISTSHLGLRRVAVPHPSAQGLLSMAPNRGRGARMVDLQEQWSEQLCAAVRAAGFPDSGAR